MLTDYFDLDIGFCDIVNECHVQWEDVKLKHPIFDIPAGTCFDWVAIDYLEGRITMGRDAQEWEFIIKPVFLTVPK